MKLRIALLATIALTMPAAANECAQRTSRDDNLSLSGIVNSYYPVVPSGANGVSGGNAVTIGPGITCAGCQPPAAGDMILLVQFQDGSGSFNSTNTSAYAANDGTGRGLPTSTTVMLSMARFSLLRVTEVNGNVLSVGNGGGNVGALDFGFGAGTTQGRLRSAMVVHVPQYANARLAGQVTAPRLQNGTITNGQLQQVGGIVVLDVAGTLDLNGQTIDVSGLGFRGGGGRQLTGSALGAGATQVAIDDWVKHRQA